MQPEIHLNWLAIAASVIASFAIGSLWYGPLFGKAWARAVGFGEGMKPAPAEIVKGSALNLLGTLLMAYVLIHQMEVWRPSSWQAGADGPPAQYGLPAAFFNWVGFIVPMLLNGVAFERKSWKAFAINGAFQLVSLLLMAMILASWR